MTNPTHPDLVAIRRRFDRARDHAAIANTILSRWHQRNNPHAVISQYNDEAREVVLKVVVTEPLPSAELSLVLSDIVHSLRTCLDNLWFSCMDSFGVKKPQGNFPIFEGDQVNKWTKMVTDPAIGGRWPDGFRSIAEDCQPFNAHTDSTQPNGHLLNDPLCQLQRLSNKDKHRSLRVVVPGPGSFRIIHPTVAFGTEDVLTVIETDGVFVRKALEIDDFNVEHFGHDDHLTLSPCVQIPRTNYFPGLTGQAGVVGRIGQLVDDLIRDLGPFVSGERTLDHDPHDRSLDSLKWSVDHLPGQFPF